MGGGQLQIRQQLAAAIKAAKLEAGAAHVYTDHLVGSTGHRR
jgi:hypothetical protein